MNRIIKVFNIDYDVDVPEDKNHLPISLEINVPSNIEEDELDDFLSDEISNITGFCHKGFTIKGE